MAEQLHVTIRDLRPEDIEAVVQVALAAWEPIYAARRQMLGEALFAAEHPDWRVEKARQVRSAGRGGAGVNSDGLGRGRQVDCGTPPQPPASLPAPGRRWCRRRASMWVPHQAEDQAWRHQPDPPSA